VARVAAVLSATVATTNRSAMMALVAALGSSVAYKAIVYCLKPC